ncbi:MAG: TIGR00282 family metallophosphoesterase [Fusobacteriaceae bacterium]
MKILVIGDVVGSSGRDALSAYISKKRKEYDFIVVNGENSASGKGITGKIADEFFCWGIDVITSGNHIWDKREIYTYIEGNGRLLRPHNYPKGVPGKGYTIQRTSKGEKIAVVSLQGRIFMNPIDCPFVLGKELIDEIKKETKFIIVDFHAEATSEKIALGKYFDGKVSLVYGTHTHVQTADEKILPEGTGYITDVGMTGPDSGVIGTQLESVLPRFLTGLPQKFEMAEGSVRLNGISVVLDDETGDCVSIERINIGDAELKY